MQAQEQEQKPPKSSKSLFWFRAISFVLLLIFVSFAAFFYIKSSTNSAYTFWYAVFVVLAVLLGIIPIILSMFSSQSAPTTIVQHFYPSVPSPEPDTSYSADQRPTSVSKLHVSSSKSETAEMIFPFNKPHLPALTELFGRERERETLLGRTHNGGATSIVGERRIGKTWLMDYVKLSLAEEGQALYQVADLDGTMPGCKTVAEFTARALEAFGVPAEFLANRSDLGLISLGKHVKDLQSKQIMPVLCIDEFEGFLDQQAFDYDFYKGLRHIAQNDGLVLIIVSKRPLIELIGEHFTTSGLYNIFRQLTLEPFSSDEAKEFVDVKSNQAGFTVEERARVLRYGQDESGLEAWPPLRLQLAGNLLLTDKRLAARGKAHLYRPAVSSYWREFEKRLAETYRGVVRQ